MPVSSGRDLKGFSFDPTTPTAGGRGLGADAESTSLGTDESGSHGGNASRRSSQAHRSPPEDEARHQARRPEEEARREEGAAALDGAATPCVDRERLRAENAALRAWLADREGENARLRLLLCELREAHARQGATAAAARQREGARARAAAERRRVLSKILAMEEEPERTEMDARSCDQVDRRGRAL